MERIEAESARMGGLVDDLLTLARMDEVREPKTERCRLGELLADACDDARAAAPEREIGAGRDAAGARCDGDADQLRRVFDNLLRNAIVHTPAGTPIEVSLEREGGEAVVRVRDHGPGLPARIRGGLRALLAQQRLARPRRRRRRPRPGDRRRDGRVPRRQGRGRQRPRRRRRVHRAAAAFTRCWGAAGEIDLSARYTARVRNR